MDGHSLIPGPPEKPKKPRTEKSVIAQRVTEVVQLLLHGAEFHDVRQFAAEKCWGLSARQLRRYVARAHRRLKSILNRSTADNLARHLAQRRAIYARTMQAQDYKTALQVLEDEAKLLDLYPKKKDLPDVPVVNIFNGPAALTFEQLKQLPPDELVRLHRETLGLPLTDQDAPARGP